MVAVKIRNKKIQLNLFDVVVLQLLVICFAFSDIRLATIGSSVIAFCFSITYLFKSKNVNTGTIKFTVSKIIFITWAALSCFWSVNLHDSAYYCVTLCLRLMVSLSILIYVDSPKKLNNLLKFIVLSALIFSIRIILVVPISAYGEARIGNYLSFDGESSYGNTGLTYILGVAGVMLLCSKRQIINNKIIKYVLVILFTVLSLLSGSKKQVFFLIIAVIIFALMNSKNKIVMLRNFIIAIVVLLFVFYLIFNNNILYNSIGVRLESMLALFIDNGANLDISTENRTLFLKYAWETFLNHPLLGVGLDGFKNLNPIELCWAENNYVELLADLGILGLIIYYIPHVIIIRKLIKCKKDWGIINYILLVLLCLIFFIDATMVSYRSNSLQIWLTVAFAINNVIKTNTIKRINYLKTANKGHVKKIF